MFDSEQAMVRLDMSEYMEKHTVARLIGAPPGYVGYEEGGQLTEAVRRRPYAVVLLDEIEKAHPDVFNTLLQIMDDGRLTDGQGRTVSFTNTVLIMTSNVGSERIVSESIDERMREQIEEVLAATFKPEFLNRIDDTVIFHRLSKEDIGRIVELQVEQLIGRVRERGIEIELSDDARTLLGNLGYDPTYGARPLKRAIQKQLVDKLALKILEGEFSEGDVVKVDADSGELVFRRAGSSRLRHTPTYSQPTERPRPNDADPHSACPRGCAPRSPAWRRRSEGASPLGRQGGDRRRRRCRQVALRAGRLGDRAGPDLAAPEAIRRLGPGDAGAGAGAVAVVAVAAGVAGLLWATPGGNGASVATRATPAAAAIAAKPPASALGPTLEPRPARRRSRCSRRQGRQRRCSKSCGREGGSSAGLDPLRLRQERRRLDLLRPRDRGKARRAGGTRGRPAVLQRFRPL